MTRPDLLDANLLDAVLRMLAIGQLVLIALVIGRGRAPRRIRLATMMLLLGVASYLTIATPLFGQIRGPVRDPQLRVGRVVGHPCRR